jgi:hypothetical protein
MVAWAPMSSSTVATGALGTTMTITGATIRRNVTGESHPLHVGLARRHGGTITGTATRSPPPLHLLGGRRGGMIVGPAASPRPLLVGRRGGMMIGPAAGLPPLLVGRRGGMMIGPAASPRPLLVGRRGGMMIGAAASPRPLLVGRRGGMITGPGASRHLAAARRPAPNPGHRRDPDPHSNRWTMIRIPVTGHCPVLNRAGGPPNPPNSGRRGMGCPVTGRRLAWPGLGSKRAPWLDPTFLSRTNPETSHPQRQRGNHHRPIAMAYWPGHPGRGRDRKLPPCQPRAGWVPIGGTPLTISRGSGCLVIAYRTTSVSFQVAPFSRKRSWVSL